MCAALVPDCFLDPHYVVSSAEKRNSFKNVTVGSVLTLSDKSLEANAKYIHSVNSAFEAGTRLKIRDWGFFALVEVLWGCFRVGKRRVFHKT